MQTVVPKRHSKTEYCKFTVSPENSDESTRSKTCSNFNIKMDFQALTKGKEKKLQKGFYMQQI